MDTNQSIVKLHTGAIDATGVDTILYLVQNKSSLRTTKLVWCILHHKHHYMLKMRVLNNLKMMYFLIHFNHFILHPSKAAISLLCSVVVVELSTSEAEQCSQSVVGGLAYYDQNMCPLPLRAAPPHRGGAHLLDYYYILLHNNRCDVMPVYIALPFLSSGERCHVSIRSQLMIPTTVGQEDVNNVSLASLLKFGSGGLGEAYWNSSELLNEWFPTSRSPAHMFTTINDRLLYS